MLITIVNHKLSYFSKIEWITKVEENNKTVVTSSPAIYSDISEGDLGAVELKYYPPQVPKGDVNYHRQS